MINQQLRQLESLIQTQNFFDAEKLCQQLQRQPDIQPAIINRALIHIYVKTDRVSLAIDLLQKEFLKQPNNRSVCDYLANLYGKNKDFNAAANCYRKFLAHQPNEPEALYNLAFNLRHAGKFVDAIEQYKLALKYNISAPEEVLVNIAVIYADHLREEKKAKLALENALKKNADYLPALFNLANLYEQSGEKHAASEWFKKILRREPNHFEALARLADTQHFSTEDSPIIRQMEKALQHKSVQPTVKVDLLFALGKAMDECANYPRAFHFYQQANELNKPMQAAYEPVEFERYVDGLIAFFSKAWVSTHSSQSNYSPVFICGMFRSGSTLIEQILASHPDVTAGGELEFFVRKCAAQLSPFPKSLSEGATQTIDAMAKEYQAYIKMRFPQAKLVTDKRPDNLFYLGLILCVFPQAKIIFTERNSLDNYLSIYFHRLGSTMNYATDLSHIKHYHTQVSKLKQHWHSLFADSIHTVNYDTLVAHPQQNVSQALTFLGLTWSDSCLNFHQLNNQVKTASVWQVRKPLYVTSSGRWRHYQTEIEFMLNG